MEIEPYKDFVNSSDFSAIYKESLYEIKKHTKDNAEFYRQYVLPAQNSGLLFLAFENKKIIGYHLVKVQNRVVLGGFTYISPPFRGLGIAKQLRLKMFETLKGQIDEIRGIIYDNNKSSVSSCFSLAAELGLNMVVGQKVMNAQGIEVGAEYSIKL
jgi:GNAT superfamily N-acetyltransferase